MEKIRLAVVGCGSIAEIAHFPSIEKREDAELVAVCDVNAKRDGVNIALQILQRAQKVLAILVRESARLIQHPGELHRLLTEYNVCSLKAITAHRALIFSTRVDHRIASWAYRHTLL